MSAGKHTMKAIQEAIARLEAEKANFNNRIDGKIEGLKEALRLQSGVMVPQLELTEEVLAKPRRRGNLKETVLSIAEEVGEKGINTEICMSMAKAKGIDLVHGSVSSLLSRLKHDGILFFDGQVYRLKQYAGPRHAA